MSSASIQRPPSVPATAAPSEGVRLHQLGDYAGAGRWFEAILHDDPDNRAALWGLGRALLRLKQWPRAIATLQQAADVRPADPEPRFDLAQALLAANRAEEAIQALREVVRLRPGWAEAWCSLGYALHMADHQAEAEKALRQALSLRPDYPEAKSRLGLVARTDPRRLEEAIGHFLEALALRPGLVEGWNNLGTTLVRQNKLGEALQAYARALALEPRNSTIRFNHSQASLLQGNLTRETWMKYEYRWVVLQESPQRGFDQPLWRGESLEGRSILLHPEQGIGDTLQFVRYAPLLAARGATVHVQVQPSLKALLQGLPGAASVLAQGDPLPRFDVQCPYLSLPFACDTRLTSIPTGVPYVTATPERVDYWANHLPAAAGLSRIGVVWRGNPKHANDANRSVPFARFRQIFDTPGRQFFSLQLDHTAAEAQTFAAHPACASLGAAIRDFSDTAAILEHLDLVVTVDTSVAHLAGAMGKPVWVLVPFAPDWRWMLRRADSPWYPTMRLFRQPAIGDWDAVLASVAAALSLPGPNSSALELPASPAA